MARNMTQTESHCFFVPSGCVSRQHDHDIYFLKTLWGKIVGYILSSIQTDWFTAVCSGLAASGFSLLPRQEHPTKTGKTRRRCNYTISILIEGQPL